MQNLDINVRNNIRLENQYSNAMSAIHVKANNASDYFRIEDYNKLESIWKNV